MYSSRLSELGASDSDNTTDDDVSFDDDWEPETVVVSDVTESSTLVGSVIRSEVSEDNVVSDCGIVVVSGSCWEV